MNDDNANVVRSAALVGCVDEHCHRGGRVVAARNVVTQQVFVLYHLPQSVAAQKKTIPRPNLMRPRINLDICPVAQGTGNDVSPWMREDILRLQLPRTHEPGHVGMVFSQLLKLSLPQAIRAAIAYVSHDGLVTVNHDTCDSRAHATRFVRILLCMGNDRHVCLLDGRLETLLQVAVRAVVCGRCKGIWETWLRIFARTRIDQRQQLSLHRCDSQLTGYLTRLMAPHAIGDNE
jgi:hypothetical protein